MNDTHAQTNKKHMIYTSHERPCTGINRYTHTHTLHSSNHALKTLCFLETIYISIKQSPFPQKRKPPSCCQAANTSSNAVWRWMFRSVLQPSRRMTWTDATTRSFLELILHGHNGRECLSNQVYTFLYGRCRCPFRN